MLMLINENIKTNGNLREFEEQILSTIPGLRADIKCYDGRLRTITLTTYRFI